MNEFDQRWRTLASQAATVAPEVQSELPFGFATRVMAAVRQSPGESWEDLLSAMGVRALVLTGSLAILSAGVGFLDWYDFRLERPKLEQSLTSELPWL